MYQFMEKPGFSLWLKPALKSFDGIIECENSQNINYKELKKGDIIELKCKDPKNSENKTLFISTSKWEEDNKFSSFITLSGEQVLLSAKAMDDLELYRVGAVNT